MLWQRVLTALVLLPLVIGGVWYLPTAYLAPILALFVLLGVRELALMTGFAGWPAAVLMLLMAVLQSLLWSRLHAELMPQLLTADAVLWLGLSLLLFTRRKPLVLVREQRPGVLALGLACLLLAWLAVVWLHAQPNGHGLLLSLLVLVWLADSAAYFAGRAFGKRKLAPMISPGKTLAGLAGALLAAVLLGAGLSQADLIAGQGMLAMALLYLVVALVSVAGDLAESAVKRQAGVKDSGQLLPGHGGVLDRIDSLIAAAPVFAALLWLLEGRS
jgi:phosphatidate cytidylyltransferase